MNWFKFYGAEYVSDPKIDMLTAQERSCWITLLCMASQSDGVIKFLSVEGLLTKSGIKFDPYDTTEWNKSLGVLQTFERLEMITITKSGSVIIKNWLKRQGGAMTGYERLKKYRENKGKMQNDNEMITDDNGEGNEMITDREDKIREEENRLDIKGNDNEPDFEVDDVEIVPEPLPKKSKKKVEVVKPDWIDTQAWGEWLQHRREKNLSSYKELGLKKLFTQLENEYGKDTARLTKAIDWSISKNYSGIYEEKKYSNQKPANVITTNKSEIVDKLKNKIKQA